jgi:nicotinate-nucleotide adenylyltransferase
MSNKRIGLFGGSFDPIHFGHINLAISMLEENKVDEVIFIPAQVSAFKVNTPPRVSGKERLKMVQMAIEGIKEFSVSDYEINKKEVSYTVDTVNYFFENVSKNLFLIMDEYVALDLDKWKSIDQIASKASFLIGQRKNSFPLEKKYTFLKKENFIPIRELEISSTEIRARLKKKLYIGHLTSQLVVDFISKNHLYLS